MNIPPAKSRHRPNAPSPVILPDDLIAEVLSFLTVKPLMRFKCVSKSWNTLISDPTFVKIHLRRSPRNTHLALVFGHSSSDTRYNCSVVPFPVRRLLENPSITFVDEPCYRLFKDKEDCRKVVGSCNGLLCLVGYSFTTAYREFWLCFWNPATRTISNKLGSFQHYRRPKPSSFKFAFGYDNSTGTYKVVAFRPRRNEVRVFRLGDNVWRNIQSFPVIPLDHLYPYHYTRPGLNDGVYLSGTINWLAIYNKFRYDWENITVDQFVIISLDLGTETYSQLLLPRGFDEVPRHYEPTIVVLNDCLCFSHDFKGTHFVIWQMTEFGVEESWTQFLKISYRDLQIQIDYDFGELEVLYFRMFLLPLHLSKNGDTLILASTAEDQAYLYNCRDNRVEQTRINNEMWWFFAKDYVESLVSTC